jgi:hypothetical protein
VRQWRGFLASTWQVVVIWANMGLVSGAFNRVFSLPRRVAQPVVERGLVGPERGEGHEDESPMTDMRTVVVLPMTRPKRAPRTARVSRRTRIGRRIEALMDIYKAALGRELSPALMLKVEAAAEANVVAEEARARFLSGDAAISLDDVVRCDRRAASAVASLKLEERNAKPAPFLERLAQLRQKKREGTS